MKNMAKMFWALISFVCLVFPCKSVEQYKFRLIDVPDGLSDNQIRGLSMVPDGRVGIRTASILNIYDGASFEYFLMTKTGNMCGHTPVRRKSIMTEKTECG